MNKQPPAGPVVYLPKSYLRAIGLIALYLVTILAIPLLSYLYLKTTGECGFSMDISDTLLCDIVPAGIFFILAFPGSLVGIIIAQFIEAPSLVWIPYYLFGVTAQIIFILLYSMKR